MKKRTRRSKGFETIQLTPIEQGILKAIANSDNTLYFPLRTLTPQYTESEIKGAIASLKGKCIIKPMNSARALSVILTKRGRALLTNLLIKE